jgi:hypothetical protein
MRGPARGRNPGVPAQWWFWATTLVALGTTSPAAQAQTFKPNHAWRVIEGPHFRTTFAEGLDSLAARTAILAESVRTGLTRELGLAPGGKVDLVLVDDSDDTNGFAMSFPSNHVILYAQPPADGIQMGDYDEWMHGLLAHELTHIWQLDRAGRVGRALRHVVGRLPLDWPLFPVSGTPNWFIEGTAVSYETGLTGRGRLAGHYDEMLLRTAILEGCRETYDRLSNPTSSWPAGNRPYAYGSLFIDHLAREHGPAVRGTLTTTCAGAIYPPSLAFDLVGRQTLGRGFASEHRAWQHELRERYTGWRDSLARVGLTTTARLAEGGAESGRSRFSPDGRHLIFRRANWRQRPEAVVVDVETGKEVAYFRHEFASNYTWLPDGGLLFSRPEWHENTRLLHDLWRFSPDGHPRRLTRDARLEDPDYSPASGAVVAVESGRGSTRLVLVDAETGRVTGRFPSPPSVHWSHPRWRPDGARIAAERVEGGRRDIVILDRGGAVRMEVTHDRACDAFPTWSPDGRFVLFASDRSGTWNLFAVDAAAAESRGVAEAGEIPPLRQVTNLVGGAIEPDISPDGQWISFSSYHADGFSIERIAFAPATWRDPARDAAAGVAAEAPGTTSSSTDATATGARGSPTLSSRQVVAAIAAPPPPDDAGASATPIFRSRPYRPWRSLRPYYWMPLYFGGSNTGSSWGALSSGSDLVGLHAWSAWGLVDPPSGRWRGSVSYSWSGLGNPVLGVSLSQSWDKLGASYDDGSWRGARERERALSATATLVRARLRSGASFTLSGELVGRHRELVGAPRDSLGAPLSLQYPHGHLFGLGAAAGFSNATSQAYSVSPEEGVIARAAWLRRWEGDRGHSSDRGYTETTLGLSAYRAVTRIGWSRGVIAGRMAGLVRTGPGAKWTDLGGVSESSVDLFVTSLGTSRFLPIRGFPAGVRAGTRAWSASLEWRMPLLLIERGITHPPIFLERTWAVAFADAGDAWAPRSQGGQQQGCDGPVCVDGYRLDPLASAGIELASRWTFVHWWTVSLRVGVARQVAGGRGGQVYFALGGGAVYGAGEAGRLGAGPAAGRRAGAWRAGGARAVVR